MLSLLGAHEELIDGHVRGLAEFVEDTVIAGIGRDYREAKSSKCELGFNVFTLASDYFYRENYHSDIMATFLNPEGNHGEGRVFLDVLIELLNKLPNRRGMGIEKENYASAKAKREHRDIDILVWSEASKHCIIVENKINNALDQQRQLPRYYDVMVGEGYQVDAIVYIPLEQSKHPDMDGWSETDKEHVQPLLCHLPAYTKDGSPNMVDDWISPCILRANNIDCLSALRQYGELVKSLNQNIMDSVIVGKFYDELKKGNNLDSALSIRNMLNDIPEFMAKRLEKALRPSLEGFCGTIKSNSNCCWFIFTVNGDSYELDTYAKSKDDPDPFCYQLEFYLKGNDSKDKAIDWIDSVAVMKDVTRRDDGHYVVHFSFYEEDRVIEWIKSFFNDVMAVVDATRSEE